jgi:hypothetical protein
MAHDALRSRTLFLHVTCQPCQFERLIAPFPGDAFDQPTPNFLNLALERLPWLNLAVRERPAAAGDVEHAVLELLRCYGYPAGRASVTQGNLLLLEGKIKAMLAAGPGSSHANGFDRA